MRFLARFPELGGAYWNIYRGVLAVKPFDRSSLRFFLIFLLFSYFSLMGFVGENGEDIITSICIHRDLLLRMGQAFFKKLAQLWVTR